MSDPKFIYQKRFLFSEMRNASVMYERIRRGCEAIIVKYGIDASLNVIDVHAITRGGVGHWAGYTITVMCDPSYAHLFDDTLILLHA